MEAKIKKILESTFAYNVENDRVAEEIDSLYKEQMDELLEAAILVNREFDDETDAIIAFKKLTKAIKNCK